MDTGISENAEYSLPMNIRQWPSQSDLNLNTAAFHLLETKGRTTQEQAATERGSILDWRLKGKWF